MLGKDDYNKLLNFTFEMNNYLNNIGEFTMFDSLNQSVNFRKYVLNLISQTLGYEHLSFFVTDEKEMYTNPVGMVNDNLMYFLRLYDHYYYKQNIFHFVNTPKALASKKLLTLSDVRSYSENRYYKFLEIHKKCSYCDVVNLPLKVNNQLLGGIAVYKSINSGHFTNKELELLRILNQYLTQGLQTYLRISQCIYKQNLLKDYTNNLLTGVIILDNNFSVIFSNDNANEFCHDLLCNNNIGKQTCADSANIQKVIDKILSKSLVKEIRENSSGHIDIDNYSIVISSFITLDHNGIVETNHAVNIVDNVPKKRISLEKVSSCYNLTKRELEMVSLIIEGYTNKEISEKLYISFHTVRNHIYNIFRKMDVKNRSAIVQRIAQIN